MSNIDRIKKLIALSGSANEHEARSAAYLACKLIREGGYEVVDATAPSPVDPWDELFRSAAAASRARRPQHREPRQPPPDVRPTRRVPSEIGRARRSGLCAVCREAFEEGSDVASPILADDANLGAAHADCRSRWSVPVDP